ncbi:uncharacterized protein LY89DRAFT_642209 [Mollisia scopiformis]|uniref:Uncharacterized protein n=1 Tax=Mollisia scopiformis TaxID=149040 RepID=A0A194XHH3_MOLSC|nr:uncharacterized protein LY89DRAFT_642209 [Mollisia scopiformis]KUJ19222.1 hypothetical protein LY89DRAFT_642209 [Mollisia scopiformis]
MYTDTKSSYDFVKEPINTPQEDPELLSLHRKLRIQKDRLVSWGLEWSDPEQVTSPDIDESINKAGLSELVGSVMGTIKEVLAEAEPLWAASRRIGAGGGDVGEKGEKSKSALIVWDKSRFQDLIRDLTMSIDTLYDLSRTRQSARKVTETRKEEESLMAVQKKVIEERQFESSRMQTPQQVDPKSIIWPREMKTMPSDSSDSSPDPLSMYRHPLDPRITRYTRLTSESKSLDLYSLAMLLLEIGLWSSLHDIFPMAAAIPENPAAVLKQLAARCGSLYVKAVQACWGAPNDELSQRARPDVMHQKVFFKVSKALDTCCAIDESSDESTEESDDSPPMPSTPVKMSRSSTPQRKPVSEKATLALNLVTSSSTPTGSRPAWSEKSSYGKPANTFPEKMGWSEKPVVKAVPAPVPIPEKAKSKLRTYPSMKISPEHLDFWQTGLLPHINHVLRGFYKKYPESVEISLENIGESPSTAKPTILTVFGLKVCRGKVVRSRKNGVKRSMAHEGDVLKAANPGHQECPSNGASIGAYVDEKHLPPVSLGGLIMVDDKPYGMTVHHMLDDPSDGEDDEVLDAVAPILRSSAYADMPDLTFSESSVYSSGDEEFMYTISDYESDDDNSSIHSSQYDSDDEDLQSLSRFGEEDQDDEDQEPGNIPGVPAGCGESFLVTQPAIDDIPSDFYPDSSTRDEDHLDSFQLGEIYASSGIRRRTENGLVHEVDWALFSYSSHRLPESNHISGGSRFLSSNTNSNGYPRNVKRTEDLSSTAVHCLARTSGLQTGRISQAMVSVKIFGRQSPSLSYQVASPKQKLGIPGDSGAWVISNDGEVCGCVLAWSTKKGVAYICPMDVLLRDIGVTLKAKKVGLPGGELVYEVPEMKIEEPEPRRGRQQIDVLDESEITKMLQELKLPPTPSQIDEDPFGDANAERDRGRENQKEDMSFLPSFRGQKGKGRVGVSVAERSSMIPQRVREGLSVSSS